MPEKPDYKNMLNRTIDALLPLLAVPLAMLIGAIMLLFLKGKSNYSFWCAIPGCFWRCVCHYANIG